MTLSVIDAVKAFRFQSDSVRLCDRKYTGHIFNLIIALPCITGNADLICSGCFSRFTGNRIIQTRNIRFQNAVRGCGKSRIVVAVCLSAVSCRNDCFLRKHAQNCLCMCRVIVAVDGTDLYSHLADIGKCRGVHIPVFAVRAVFNDGSFRNARRSADAVGLSVIDCRHVTRMHAQNAGRHNRKLCAGIGNLITALDRCTCCRYCIRTGILACFTGYRVCDFIAFRNTFRSCSQLRIGLAVSLA